MYGLSRIWLKFRRALHQEIMSSHSAGIVSKVLRFGIGSVYNFGGIKTICTPKSSTNEREAMCIVYFLCFIYEYCKVLQILKPDSIWIEVL